jgi:hypothetical protein
MGLRQLRTGQFTFSQQKNKKQSFEIIYENAEGTMIITIPSLIAAGIATAVVTGGITGTALYLTAGDADVVTGNQIKTAHPGAGPHGAMGHSYDVRYSAHRDGHVRRLLPQEGQKLRQGKVGKAPRPCARQGKGARAHEGPRGGGAATRRANVPRHAPGDRGTEDAPGHAAALRRSIR